MSHHDEGHELEKEGKRRFGEVVKIICIRPVPENKKLTREEVVFDLMVEFLVVDVLAAFSAIIGRLLIHKAHVAVSTYHLTMVYMSNAGQP